MRLISSLVIICFTGFVTSAQTESEILQELYDGSFSTVEQANNLNEIGVEAVWIASSLSGTSTFTGTLSQSAQNLQNWTYSAEPSTKLLIKFANGAEMSYTFSTFNGYVDGSESDFLDSHSMEYDVEIPQSINLHITSVAQQVDKNIELTKKINGTTKYSNYDITVNLTSTEVKKNIYVVNGFANGEYEYQNVGSIQSMGIDYSVNERYYTAIGHNSNAGIYVQDRQIWSSNSASGNFGSFTFQNLFCRYIGGTSFPDSATAGIYNSATEVYNWGAQGTLLKNNQYYGDIQFDSPPLEYTYGPRLIANCTDGNKFILDYLLNPIITSIKKNELSLNKFDLSQNYPNPFNPTTNIEFSIPLSAGNQFINLSVFDILGKKVATLVNEDKSPGSYSIKFDASELVSGIYIYRLSAENFSSTRKMLLIK